MRAGLAIAFLASVAIQFTTQYAYLSGKGLRAPAVASSFTSLIAGVWLAILSL